MFTQQKNKHLKKTKHTYKTGILLRLVDTINLLAYFWGQCFNIFFFFFV